MNLTEALNTLSEIDKNEQSIRKTLDNGCMVALAKDGLRPAIGAVLAVKEKHLFIYKMSDSTASDAVLTLIMVQPYDHGAFHLFYENYIVKQDLALADHGNLAKVRRTEWLSPDQIRKETRGQQVVIFR